MDEIIAACMNYEGSLCEIEDFPQSGSPVWILGKQYSTEDQLEDIRCDVRSRLWMTYRKNFSQISNTAFTSDKGWGCMLRCGQMVMAESLIRFHLGRDWRWIPSQEGSTMEETETYHRIVSLFEDDPRRPFSIHAMAQQGVAEGKQVGEWHGPNTVAHVLRQVSLLERWTRLGVSVVMDNVFIKDEIRQSCLPPPCGGGVGGFRPLVIFIPLRLGVSEINPIYIPALKKCLEMPQSVGVIGGKPNHALFFVGFTGDDLVYLDPHTTQEAAPPSRGPVRLPPPKGEKEDDDADTRRQLRQEEEEAAAAHDLTFHCGAAQRLPFALVDPSVALCFVVASEKELGDLCNRLRREVAHGGRDAIVEVCDTRPSYLMEDGGCCDAAGAAAGMDLLDHHLESDEDEDFEILE